MPGSSSREVGHQRCITYPVVKNYNDKMIKKINIKDTAIVTFAREFFFLFKFLEKFTVMVITN